MQTLTVVIMKIADGVFNISPKGSIDSDTYEILQKKMDPVMHSTPKMIIFDMKEVVYISSMGLKAILDAKNKVEASGGALLLVNLQPQITKVFDIIKAIPSKNIFKSREELDQYLTEIQRQEIEKRKSS